MIGQGNNFKKKGGGAGNLKDLSGDPLILLFTSRSFFHDSSHQLVFTNPISEYNRLSMPLT